MFRTLLGLGLLFSAAPLAVAEDSRPNILFAFADDWGRYAGIYAELEPGGPSDLVKTPHFDRIAREGIVFTRAYVNAPSCTPCRSSLLSGQYFWRTKRSAILQGAVWNAEMPTYPILLENAGYHIGYTWKVWGPGTPGNSPFTKKHAYNRRGSSFNRYSQTASSADDPKKAQAGLLEQVRGNFRDFLDKRKEGQPFCYWFGPTNCHRKWTRGSGKHLWGIEPDQMKGKMPKFLPDTHVVREDFCDYLGEVQAFDAGLGVLLKELEQNGELDNTMIVVSGDHGIPGFPNGKCNLYDFGAAVPLAIRWGKNITAAGRVSSDFVSLPDLAPTFVEAAGLKPPQVMTGKSLMSLLKSSRSGQIEADRDAVLIGRERHVAAARTDFMPYPQRAIRTNDYLYIRNFAPDRWPMGTGPGHGLPAGPLPTYEQLRENTFSAFGDLDASPTKAWIATNRDKPGMRKYYDIAFGRRPAEELYDVHKDPDQINNLANDPKYADAKKKLSQRLMKTLKETGDPRVTGDGSTFDKPPFAAQWKRKK